MNQLEGKTALITGAASGIGRSTAILMASHGAKIMVSDVNTEGGAETVRMIEEADGTAAFVRTDVSKPEEVRSMVEQTVAQFGSPGHCSK